MTVTYKFRKISPADRKAMEEYRASLPPPEEFKPGETKMPIFPPVALPAGVFKESVTLNGVKSLHIHSKDDARDAVIMYFHGGGYVWGTPEDGMAFLVEAKKRINIDSYSVDYSLAPESRFPVQLNECLSFYQGLLGMGYKKIVLVGESAGGNMSLTLTLKLKDDKMPLPSAVVSISGLLDYTFSGGIELHDRFVQGMGFMAEQYAGKQDLKNPLISPVYGDYNGFPPLLLQAGTMECFSTDAKYLAKKIEATDCECVLSIWEEAGHVFSAGHEDTPVGRGGLTQVLDFINKHLA